MKQRILKGVNICITLLFLASCTIMASVEHGNLKGPNAHVSTHAVSASFDEKGVNTSAGTSTSSATKGTDVDISSTGESAARSILLEELQKYKNIELNDKQLEDFLRSLRAYNKSLSRQNSMLRNEISQLRRKTKPEDFKRRLAEKLVQAEAQRSQLRQVTAEVQRLSNNSVQSKKVKLQGMIQTLDGQNRDLDRIIAELQNISKSGRVRIGN